MNDAPFDIGSIESWVESLEVPAVQARIEDIGRQIEGLTEERRRWEAALEFKEKWDEAHTDETVVAPAGQVAVHAHFPLDSDIPVEGKTDAALRVLGSEPDRAWSIAAIAQTLISRGWMEASDNEVASLASTLSRLYSEGRIYRPHRGRYQLAQPRDTL